MVESAVHVYKEVRWWGKGQSMKHENQHCIHHHLRICSCTSMLSSFRNQSRLTMFLVHSKHTFLCACIASYVPWNILIEMTSKYGVQKKSLTRSLSVRMKRFKNEKKWTSEWEHRSLYLQILHYYSFKTTNSKKI